MQTFIPISLDNWFHGRSGEFHRISGGVDMKQSQSLLKRYTRAENLREKTVHTLGWVSQERAESSIFTVAIYTILVASKGTFVKVSLF